MHRVVTDIGPFERASHLLLPGNPRRYMHKEIPRFHRSANNLALDLTPRLEHQSDNVRAITTDHMDLFVVETKTLCLCHHLAHDPQMATGFEVHVVDSQQLLFRLDHGHHAASNAKKRCTSCCR